MPLQANFRLFIFLAILSGLNILLLLLFKSFLLPTLSSGTVLTLVMGFTFIALVALLIFFKGLKKGPEKSVILTLIALGVKMLLSFIFALVFIVVLKNREMALVILFFVLYLEFTSFVVYCFLNTLKKSNLKEQKR